MGGARLGNRRAKPFRRRTHRRELLTAADLYVQSSRREGMPISLIEVSRAACPLWPLRSEGPERSDDGRCGFSSRPVTAAPGAGDGRALADGIEPNDG